MTSQPMQRLKVHPEGKGMLLPRLNPVQMPLALLEGDSKAFYYPGLANVCCMEHKSTCGIMMWEMPKALGLEVSAQPRRLPAPTIWPCFYALAVQLGQCSTIQFQLTPTG
mmetsp:Transcript_39007/g.99771  ORF Transcript_39007/g.99771 Transcript_39007/m.99771 type:complete len:110 (+) Transcript_39007:1384-1713(+)